LSFEFIHFLFEGIRDLRTLRAVPLRTAMTAGMFGTSAVSGIIRICGIGGVCGRFWHGDIRCIRCVDYWRLRDFLGLGGDPDKAEASKEEEFIQLVHFISWGWRVHGFS
jgi:hypothetical protein